MLQCGRNSEAKALCAVLCLHNKTDAESWFLLAAINAQLGLFEETANTCRKVIELDPSHDGARYNLGVALQFMGRLDEAAAAYRELIKQQATHAAACNNLGQVLRKQQKPDEAIDWFKKALDIDPGRTDIQNNLGLAYADQGNLDAAASIFMQILPTDPDNSETLNNLGRVRQLQSRHLEAVQHLERALEINPEYAEAHNTLANIFLATGRFAEAAGHFLHAIRIEPDNAAFHYNLGNAYQSQHKQPDAAREYRSALKIYPGYVEAWNNLGQCLLLQDEPWQAIECFRQALLIQPENAAIHHNASAALWRTGARKEALEHALQAILHAPGNRMFRQNFSQIAGMSTAPLLDSGFEKELETTLAVRGIDHQLLVSASLSLLAHRKRFADLLELAERQQSEVIASRIMNGELAEIFHNGLFHGILSETVMVDVRFERFLKILRRLFLELITSTNAAHASRLIIRELDFMCALACQCFNNEYIYLADSLEQQNAAKLIASVETRLEKKDIPHGRLMTDLVVACMYAPLYRIRHHQSLLDIDQTTLPKAVHTLIKRQLIDPGTDLALYKQIETITPIDDETSQAVRDQYEGLPYPRWLDVSLHEPRPLADVFSSMFTHFRPSGSLSNTPSILIAGCGSGRHAIITATRFADAEILAVDLSKSSLAYAKRMANDLGVENIEFVQGDILKLDTLDKRFDIIESVGVLHHMADPLKGLKILLELLRPCGLINIGLYSKLARRSIIATQKFFHERGYNASDDDLRKAREEILALDLSDPMYSITSTQDFYSLSEFCDLAFHAHEVCYTLPEVARILDRFNLRFIGFELSDPAIKLHYKKLYPEDKNLTNLSNWSAFEHRFPDTFTEMYTFWSQRRDLPEPSG